MTALEVVKGAVLLFVAALLQVSIVPTIEIADGRPDVLVVLVVSLALLRGAAAGACAGFWAGLVFDVASFGTLGLTSLLLVLVGYGAGRFGEATSRRSAHPLLIAVALATLGFGVGSLVLHYMLGATIAASHFVVGVLLPGLALNLLLAYPVYALARRLFPLPARERREVSLAG